LLDQAVKVADKFLVSGPIVATSFTHNATVSGGAGPTPVSSGGASTLSNNRCRVAGSRQSASPSQRAKRSSPMCSNRITSAILGASIAGENDLEYRDLRRGPYAILTVAVLDWPLHSRAGDGPPRRRIAGCGRYRTMP